MSENSEESNKWSFVVNLIGKIASNCLAVVALLLPALWLFQPALSGENVLSFRDAARFYYPTTEWVMNEWRHGRVPLWNPNENTGTSILGETTTSPFYPGNLIFFLPIGFSRQFNAFILLHVVLAAATTYFVARKWGYSQPAATLSGVIYAYSAPVLFNYSNQVFLVSAAWLPLGICVAENCIRKRSRSSPWLVGAVMAVMILGGDPQTAYHLGLVAALGVVYFGIDGIPNWQRLKSAALMACRHLAWIAVSVLVLSAIQTLPSWEWGRESERAMYLAPRSVWEFAAELKPGVSHDRPRGFDAHQSNTYDFSVAPWRILEVICPNVFGTTIPQNQRWANVFGNEGRIWCPSIFVGTAGGLLACAAVRFGRGSIRRRWLSWATCLALFAAFGGFGVGWLLNQCGLTSTVQPATGGLYWWLVWLAPGYAYFRYPAKWMVVAALGGSLLSGNLVSRSDSVKTTSVVRGSLIIVFAGIVGTVLIHAYQDHLCSRLVNHVPADIITGRIDAQAAVRTTQAGLCQMTVVSACVWVSLVATRLRTLPQWFLVAITAVDLLLANSWMISLTSKDKLASAASLGTTSSVEQLAPYVFPLRIYRSPTIATSVSWQATESHDRLDASLTADIETLFLRIPWRLVEQGRFASIESHGSIWNADYRLLLSSSRNYQASRSFKLNGPSGSTTPDWNTLRLLGTNLILVPDTEVLAEPDQVQRLATFTIGPTGALLPSDNHSRPRESLGRWSLWELKNPLSRVRIIHDVVVLNPVKRHLQALEVRTAEVLFPSDQPRDFIHTAVIEAERSAIEGSWLSPAFSESNSANGFSQSNAGECCRIIEESPTRIHIEANLKRDGLLVLSDLYASGWSAKFRSNGCSQFQPLAILRTNRVQRGVLLPAGNHLVRFEYQPNSVSVGALISLIGWCVLLYTHRRVTIQRALGTFRSILHNPASFSHFPLA